MSTASFIRPFRQIANISFDSTAPNLTYDIPYATDIPVVIDFDSLPTLTVGLLLTFPRAVNINRLKIGDVYLGQYQFVPYQQSIAGTWNFLYLYDNPTATTVRLSSWDIGAALPVDLGVGTITFDFRYW